MKFSQEEAQQFFDTDIEELKKTSQDNLNYESQTHFGDFIVEEYHEGDERARLFRNNDENTGMGENLIEVEYFGKATAYSWETVFTF